MVAPVIADSSAVVAALDRRDEHHLWAKQWLAKLEPPYFTCEAVLTESYFLLSKIRGGSDAFLRALEEGLLAAEYRFAEEQIPTVRLIQLYSSVPMSFADACLVRMSEIQSNASIFTTDRDFTIYRKNRREVIPLIAPW
jgi:predicted nucleic acid-binding protein